MTLKDQRGVPVSTGNRKSLDGLQAATELLHGYFGDPLAAIDKVLADDPGFVMGHCFRAGLITTTTDKSAEPLLRESVAAAESLLGDANDRERGYIAAARAWLDGDFEGALDAYGKVAFDYPRDSLALQLGHLGDFYLGRSSMLRDRIAQALPAWDKDVPGYGYLLGMHAFGLEEMGDYRRAEETGRRAIEANPRDPWAVHAVAHVMEMQGRLADGVRWLTERTDDWAPDNGFAFHNWWHLSLYHLDIGQIDRVLQLYDRRIRPQSSSVILEMVDASALLWRLHLRDVDCGDRWAELADQWEAHAEDGYYTFNDLHAMLAFTATGRHVPAERLLTVMWRRAGEGGSNGALTRDVGLPLCQAIQAFGRRDFGTAVDLLLQARPIAQRFGGSHAQRDIISLTLTEAALRSGRGSLARALMAERTDLKPRSPSNWRDTARAFRLLGDKGAAEQAQSQADAAMARASATLPISSAA